jgi:hypothetical protein
MASRNEKKKEKIMIFGNIMKQNKKEKSDRIK